MPAHTPVNPSIDRAAVCVLIYERLNELPFDDVIVRFIGEPDEPLPVGADAKSLVQIVGMDLAELPGDTVRGADTAALRCTIALVLGDGVPQTAIGRAQRLTQAVVDQFRCSRIAQTGDTGHEIIIHTVSSQTVHYADADTIRGAQIQIAGTVTRKSGNSRLAI